MDTPSQIYEVGPIGGVRVNKDWFAQIDAFATAVAAVVGPQPKVTCWQYRLGTVACMVYDATGPVGNANITVCLSGAIDIPTPEYVSRGSDISCAVTDCVDAFYLCQHLTQVLGASIESLDASFSG